MANSNSSSKLMLLFNLACLSIYGYSFYYMAFILDVSSIQVTKTHAKYGLLRFLTFQCLCMQIFNSLLHVGAYFSDSLRKPRDLWFSCLAYPVGSMVVYTFWGVWHIMGRELMFPAELDKFYPAWLNHSTHSIIAPINLLQLVFVRHQYSRFGLLVTLAHMLSYLALLNTIKAQTGVSVYKYLDAFTDTQRNIYFASIGVTIYILYKSGEYLTQKAHGDKATVASSRPSSKKQKQR